jgi:hypothetical protein
MSLRHNPITPIPNTEPDAVPALWNNRYEEIDENFEDLDQRLGEAEANVEGLDPDMQNAIFANLMVAMDAAGLAMRELERWKNVRLQEGEITIFNRGVIIGCAVSASSVAARNLDLLAGKFFAHGREFSFNDEEAVAAVPGNSGAESAVCYAYLMIDGSGIAKCNCTGLGEAVPENGTEVAMLTIPAGNTEATDPNLDNVTIGDTRRLEPLWPMIAQNPAWESIALDHILPDAGYAVFPDIVSFEGGVHQLGELLTQDKLKNGFKLMLTGTVDAVKVRYLAGRIGI